MWISKLRWGVLRLVTPVGPRYVRPAFWERVYLLWVFRNFSVLPQNVPARISVEQAATFGWSQYVGHAGKSLGMRSFGASAPLKELQKRFGFTADAVVTAAREMLGKKAPGR